MKSNNNTSFLYLTTFLCGASIMGVEISSSRFMAPYFGSSMITWTIIIGVILVAMSLGNFWGGYLADRTDPEKKLYQLILWSAIWIAFIPIVGKYVIAFILTSSVALFPGNTVLVGSLLSCIILFAFPCVILGAASPCIIKAGTKSLEDNGRIAGRIYGLSTLGSIFGTILPTFFTIPTLGTNKTFFLFAAVLGVIALANAIRNGLGTKKQTLVCVVIFVLAFAPFSKSFAFWEKPLLETESIYNYLLVKQKKDVTSLSTHVLLGTQSMFSPELGLTKLYFDLALLSHYFIEPSLNDKKMQILVLGFATGTFAKLNNHYFPDCKVDGVEIDPKIIELGKQYFDLKDDDAKVYIEDGRVYLYKTPKKYKIIFLDAFQDVTYPFHMATREFFKLAEKHLDKDGVLVINLNMRSKIKLNLSKYLEGTVASVFDKTLVCSHPDYYNKIIFASNNLKMLDTYSNQIKKLSEDHKLKKLAELALQGMKELKYVKESKAILTDDLAPVELIGFNMLNEQIKGFFRELLIRVIFNLKYNFG